MSDIVALVSQALADKANPVRANHSSNWFKNRPGYSSDDLFLGVKVPDQRFIAKKFLKLTSLIDCQELLRSKWHEERLTALIILVEKYKKQPNNRQAIFDLYFENIDCVNNWDLVDTSAPGIVGAHLFNDPYKLKVLLKLAVSDKVWTRRIAMISTHYSIRQGDPSDTMHLAKKLLKDPDEYIHKAVGWMLREVGKRINRSLLIGFLDEYAQAMPRIALRYAIEHLSPSQRKMYMEQNA